MRQLANAVAQQQQQRVVAPTWEAAPAVAAAPAQQQAAQQVADGWGGDGESWADAASIGFGQRTSSNADSAGGGGYVVSPRGRPLSAKGPGSLQMGASSQLLGNAAPSEPGEWGVGG